MSATVLNLHEFIEDFRREVEALELHPSIDITGRVAEMHEAIERGDTDEFKRLIHLTQRKVADELAPIPRANGQHTESTFPCELGPHEHASR